MHQNDLAPDTLAGVAPAAFLVLQTSPRGRQAWVAVQDAPKGFAARLKEGTGADREASGATRVAGTANFKPAYAPNFPVVRILAAQPGHLVTPATLEALHLVASAKPISPAVASRTTSRTGKWPSYARCLEGAPLGANGHAKRTSVDFVWCKIAISWEHSIEATAERLHGLCQLQEHHRPDRADRRRESGGDQAQQVRRSARNHAIRCDVHPCRGGRRQGGSRRRNPGSRQNKRLDLENQTVSRAKKRFWSHSETFTRPSITGTSTRGPITATKATPELIP